MPGIDERRSRRVSPIGRVSGDARPLPELPASPGGASTTGAYRASTAAGASLDHARAAGQDGAADSTAAELATAFLMPAGEPHAVRKADRFMTLAPAERAQLRSLAGQAYAVPARALVQERGQPVTGMKVLVAGMAAQVAVDDEGRRYSSRFFLPGDIVGAHEIALSHHATDVVAVTGCRFAWVPKHLFVTASDTRLWRLFHLFRMVEQVMASDRIGMLVRGRAEERVLHVLLELHARQRVCVPRADGAVWLPLTQGEIGNAAGLTNVYVSRVMGRLRDSGIVRDEGGDRYHKVVTLSYPDQLARRIDFVDRYSDLDVAWALNGAEGGFWPSADGDGHWSHSAGSVSPDGYEALQER